MNIMCSPTIQTIHLSGAGRAAVLAHLLAPDLGLAAAIGDWVDRLVACAPLLDITLNTQDVRTLLPAPIEELDNVLTKSHASELRGYGAMDTSTAQVLDQWCVACSSLVAELSSVLWRTRASPDQHTPLAQAYPATIVLTKYQRMALNAAMQVAADTLVTLASILCLARAPNAALFWSSLTADDIARCDGACAGLAALFAWGHAWVAQQPADRQRDMVREHVGDADISLQLLFEGTHDYERRQILARLLIDLSILKRRV